MGICNIATMTSNEELMEDFFTERESVGMWIMVLDLVIRNRRGDDITGCREGTEEGVEGGPVGCGDWIVGDTEGVRAEDSEALVGIKYVGAVQRKV